MTPTVLCHADVKRHKNHPHHLGSIALNNMAVSLLERGNYVEALEAMKDSINLMKVFCRPHGSHNVDDVQGLLFQATHKCLHSHSDRTFNVESSRARASATIQCRNLTHDLCDEVVVPTLTQRPPKPSVIAGGSIRTGDQTSHVIYPIRIDECLCGFGEPDFESAVSANFQQRCYASHICAMQTSHSCVFVRVIILPLLELIRLVETKYVKHILRLSCGTYRYSCITLPWRTTVWGTCKSTDATCTIQRIGIPPFTCGKMLKMFCGAFIHVPVISICSPLLAGSALQSCTRLYPCSKPTETKYHPQRCTTTIIRTSATIQSKTTLWYDVPTFLPP
jgi:hypothetical protein